MTRTFDNNWDFNYTLFMQTPFSKNKRVLNLLPVFFLVLLIGIPIAGEQPPTTEIPGMKRIMIPHTGEYDKTSLKTYDLKPFRINGETYAFSTREGASFRGDIIFLDRKPKRLDFTPRLKGPFNMRMDFQLYVAEPVSLTVHSNKNNIYQKTFQEKGIFHLDVPLDLSTGHTITLELTGKGTLLLGNPLFYKKKPEQDAFRTHVFIICADTLRADHLQVYGYQRETSPNLQAFSRDCVVFNNAYCQSPWTLPSHASLFTGLYEYNHGLQKDGVLSPKRHHLVESLSRSFATRSINGGGWLRGSFGFHRGFDYYKSYGRCGAKPQSAESLFKFTIDDLKNNHMPKSFYFLHSYQIHAPYQPPARFLAPFNPKPQHRSMGTPTGMNAKNTPPQKLENTRRMLIDLYDGEIRTFDHWFGEFIEYLKKENIYRNSLIVFLSDHGEEFYEHEKWGHSHELYNEVTRVPLLIKFPGSRFKGKTVREEVGLIDVLPTILSYYKIDYPSESIDGQNLLPVIQGKPLDRVLVSSITCGYYHKSSLFRIGLFEDNHKLLSWIPYKKTGGTSFHFAPRFFQYFNLEKNPRETDNIYFQNVPKIRSFYSLLRNIIKQGILQLKDKNNKQKLDPKTQNALKSLGYL